MEPLTGLQVLSTAFTGYEKASKVLREWAGKLPDTPAKEAAVKDLKQAEEAMPKSRWPEALVIFYAANISRLVSSWTYAKVERKGSGALLSKIISF
jgi:hypothetical protein